MKIYIAGPCSSVPDHNLPAFAAAAQQLSAAGFEPVNPTRDGVIDGYMWVDYMRAALVDLVWCDAVALLPGWRHSRGARFERSVAKELGMEVRELAGWLDEAVAS